MKPSRSALFELGNHESVVRAPEDEVRLRMEIGAIFRKAVIRDESFRNELVENHHWTPSTPAIPCEWSRTVGDVFDAAERFFEQGHDTVAVPVLVRENGMVKLVVGAMDRSSGLRGIGDGDSIMSLLATMDDLYKTASGSGNWVIADVDGLDIAPFRL